MTIKRIDWIEKLTKGLGRKHFIYASLALFLWGFTPDGLSAGTYYVSPDGKRGAGGVRSDPWSLEHACAHAKAGDTIILLSGDYEGQRLEPLNSGREGSPLVFRAEERRKARLTGGGIVMESSDRLSNIGKGGQPIVVASVSHIHIEGIYVDVPRDEPYREMAIDAASYIVVKDCRFRGGTGFQGVLISHSEQIKILDNDFSRESAGSNPFDIRSSQGVLVEGNSFTRAMHTGVVVRPGRPSEGLKETDETVFSERVVFRGNVFHSGWSRNFENFGHPEVMLENNILTNSFDGGRSAGSTSKMLGDRMIFRYNKVFRNYHRPQVTMRWREGHSTHNARYYHNIFYGNKEVAHIINSQHHQVSDMQLKNNIFKDNDPYGEHTHIAVTGGDERDLQLRRNVFHGGPSGNPNAVIYGYMWGGPLNTGTTLSIEEAQSGMGSSAHGRMFVENIELDPLFEDADRFNFALKPQSPIRDAGHPLAHTTSSGEGLELPVDDTYPFYDGYGIKGEEGDLIAVGNADKMARVEGVDHANGILRLDRSLSWSKGDRVSFLWYGDGPDIGVYEHGEGYIRPSVQILADAVDLKPGQTVRLEAVARGLKEPLSYHWQLGDDSVAQGRFLQHRYEKEVDYGIRVRVIDAEGRRAMGVGYVNVEAPGDPDVLMHSTFDDDIVSNYVKWQMYRPAPAWFRLRLEDGHAHIRAPSDRGRLPAYTSPRGWDIDRYPTLRIRYRISRGTPVALWVEGFQTASEGQREFYLAGTGSEPVGDKRLIDNGRWHVAEFDVRRIREKYPDVDMIRSLRIGALDDGARVKEGDEYWLDEVYIGK